MALFKFKIYLKILLNIFIIWGLGIGDWGLGIGPNPQSPIPNPQSPIPNPHFYINKIKMIFYYLYIKYIKYKIIYLFIFFVLHFHYLNLFCFVVGQIVIFLMYLLIFHGIPNSHLVYCLNYP